MRPAEARRRAAALTNLDTGAWWWFTPFVGSADRQRDQAADAREARAEPREADLEGREAAVEAREPPWRHARLPMPSG
jgi:hypothetical protein